MRMMRLNIFIVLFKIYLKTLHSLTLSIISGNSCILQSGGRYFSTIYMSGELTFTIKNLQTEFEYATHVLHCMLELIYRQIPPPKRFNLSLRTIL